MRRSGSPLPELRHPSYGVRAVYLFLAAGAVAMIPGGVLTFADGPLYATYELAPRALPLNAADDQQLAGIIMKVGNLPVVWAVILVMVLRWVAADQGKGTAAYNIVSEDDAIDA